MGIFIEDAKGTGNKLAIDSFNRGLIFSTNETQEHHAAKLGQCFMANSSDTANTLTVPDAFSGPFMYLFNSSTTKQIGINKILFSASATGIGLVITQTPDVGSVANNNTHTPINTNSGTNNSAAVTCYNWDETGTAGITGLTGGQKQSTFTFGAGLTVMPVDGSFIIGMSQALMISLTNATGGSIECTLNIRFFFESV